MPLWSLIVYLVKLPCRRLKVIVKRYDAKSRFFQTSIIRAKVWRFTIAKCWRCYENFEKSSWNSEELIHLPFFLQVFWRFQRHTSRGTPWNVWSTPPYGTAQSYGIRKASAEYHKTWSLKTSSRKKMWAILLDQWVPISWQSVYIM